MDSEKNNSLIQRNTSQAGGGIGTNLNLLQKCGVNTSQELIQEKCLCSRKKMPHAAFPPSAINTQPSEHLVCALKSPAAVKSNSN